MLRSVGISWKVRDNILRDCEFFNKILIDIHEARFLLRTGIFHEYAPEDADPLNYDHLAQALRIFAKQELREIEIYEVKLSDAPGIVDLAIWLFSQEKTVEESALNICGKQTKMCQMSV